MATFTSTPNKEYYVRLIVNQTSQNIANNTSTVSWELWVGNGVNTMQYNGQQLSASINGKTVYSATQQITLLSKNMTVKIASGTETIEHNADGTKTIACSGQWIPTGSYAPSATLTASGSLPLTTIPRASSVSLASTEVAYGSRLTININRATSSFTHDVTITLPNRTQTYTGVATQQLFDIPLDWLNGYTNGLRASGTVTVQTKSGSTNIGSAVSVNFASPVPSNIVPTVSIARTAFNSGLAGFNEPIQGISTMTLTRTAGGAYGSTITKTEWWANAGGISGSGDAVSFTAANVNPQYIYCKVTDSRGRPAQVTYTSWNHGYSNPTLSLSDVGRCDVNNTFQNDGTYFRFKPTFTFTSLGGVNTVTMHHKVNTSPEWTYTSASPVSGGTYGPDGAGRLDKTKAYTVTITLTDKVGKTTTATANIPVSEVLMNFPSAANALGIGMYSQGANRLDIGWNTDIKGTLNVGGTINGFPIVNKSNGTHYNKLVGVDASGVMEIGKYIDFHDGSTDTSDYNVRLFATNGVLACYQPISTNGWINTAKEIVTQTDVIAHGNIDAGKSLIADTIGVDNISSTTGKGISLYGGAETGMPRFGFAFAGTAVWGTQHDTTALWATYFTMEGEDGRGWIFRNMSTSRNVASISNRGWAYFTTVLSDSYPMSNRNLNDLTSNGIYQGYTGMTNAPIQNIAAMEVIRYSHDWVIQNFYEISNGGTPRRWRRHKYAGTTWSAWTTW